MRTLAAASLGLSFILIAPFSHAQGAPSAKAESQRLMNAIVPFAERMIQQDGEFEPFGAALTPEGRVMNVSGHDGSRELPEEEVVEGLRKAFVAGARAGAYRATAMVADVKVTLPASGEPSDAIAVSLDHRDDYSVVVVLPYRLQDGALIFGDPIAQPGEGRIFGAEPAE